jgi:hypothetical protein
MRHVRGSAQDAGSALNGIERTRASAWSEHAPSILAPRVRAAGEALIRLEGKVELARTLLSTVAIRGPRTRYAVERASSLLEKVQLDAGLARVLLRRDAAWAGMAPRSAMARRELSELRPILYQVHEVLARLARRAAIRPTPGEIGDIDRAAQVAREALVVLQTVAEVLLELTHRPDLPLTPGDIRALGLAFPGTTLPPQTRWNEESVDELGRRRVEGRRSRRVELTAGTLASVGAADILAALKASGLELAQVDPGQLQPAARFVARAGPQARSERLAKAVDAFHVLARSQRTVWSRQRMASHLAGIAGVPTRAMLRLPDSEVVERFHEVVRAFNTGPGPACVRIGPYHVSFEADEDGHLAHSSRLKDGVLFRAAGALGRSGPLTVTTLRHYRATEPLGRLLAGSLDTGERLGRSAFARLASAGAALLRTAAARNATESSPLPVRLDRASRELEDAAVMNVAVASYRSAERATVEARRALSRALSSSDPAAVVRAKRRFDAAEEAKRAALQHCAAGLLHAGPEDGSLPETGSAGPAPSVPRRAGALAKTEQPDRTERPATTGASLQGLALQLRQTRSLVERVKQTASDLHDLAHRPGVPEDLRQTAGASALAVEKAIQSFQRAIGAADDEHSTQAARLAFEKRVMGIVAEHQEIHIALAALAPPPPPSKRRR